MVLSFLCNYWTSPPDSGTLLFPPFFNHTLPRRVLGTVSSSECILSKRQHLHHATRPKHTLTNMTQTGNTLATSTRKKVWNTCGSPFRTL